MHLKEYLEKNGVVKQWFAAQIGVHATYLGDALRGRRPMATKYWTEITLLTRGKVRYDDLLKMNMAYEENRERKRSEKKILESSEAQNNSQLS